jgi:hypothetical protein
MYIQNSNFAAWQETGDVLRTRREEQIKTKCDVRQAVLVPQSFQFAITAVPLLQTPTHPLNNPAIPESYPLSM